jgi:hypothetical protein
MRSVFGWSLPPGCTSQMIDEAAGVDQPCAICCMDVADCCCPECPECGEQGNPNCYHSVEDTTDFPVIKKSGHGLKLNKEQALSRQRAVIYQAKQRVQDEETAYLAMQNGSTTEWHLNELPDPWG